jgi:hypothetical protein
VLQVLQLPTTSSLVDSEALPALTTHLKLRRSLFMPLKSNMRTV